MALDSIQKVEMSRRKASNSYGIPRSTLIKQLKLRPTDRHQPRLGRYRPVFSDSLRLRGSRGLCGPRGESVGTVTECTGGSVVSGS